MIYFDINKKAYAYKIPNPIATVEDDVWIQFADTDKWDIINGEFVDISDTDEYKKRKAKEERERILELRMTPLDFLKAIEQYGITYDMVKQFMEENPLIERELKFCQFVYRKHPMLQSLSEYGITSEILDTIFRKANGEDV